MAYTFARCLATLLAGVACARPSPSSVPVGSQKGAPTVAVAGRLFEFHSGMWVNLHHFLYAVARARSRHDTSHASLADTVGLGARSADERRAWEAALAYYAAGLAGRDLLFDTGMIAINNRLAELEQTSSLRGVGLDTQLVAALDRAAPVYRAVWWQRHDATNRAWVASMLPLLERYGDTLAAGLTRALDTSWPARPVRVDVAPYSNWAGAYTTDEPPHVTISSTDAGYQGTLGLEMLFHEASHAMADSLLAALRDAAAASGRRPQFEVLHAIIFYTAGELARRTVAGHTPFALRGGLWERGRMAPYYPLLQRHWTPHLDGRSRLREAMRDIVGEL